MIPPATTIPTLDYTQALDPEQKPLFLASLKTALINDGFLYLSNPPIPRADMQTVVDYIPRLFNLPLSEKNKFYMTRSPAFLGYSRLLAKGKQDYREQFHFGTESNYIWTPGQPDYYKSCDPSQWPDEDVLPGFQATYERYLSQLTELSLAFTDLIAEALSIPKEDLRKFFIHEELPPMHRAKIIQYPVPTDASSQLGVRPHYDGGFLTFLLQCSDHRCLQVQSLHGDWLNAPPEPFTFVVNFGKALEYITQGAIRATPHRVLAPAAGSLPRYSLPFFQNCLPDIKLSDVILPVPSDILEMRDARDKVVPPGTVDQSIFDHSTEFHLEPIGQLQLIHRVKSHPITGQNFYPELFHQLFPDGRRE